MRWRCRASAPRRSASARIADLAGHAPNFSIAGDYEFFGRPEWARASARPMASTSASSGRCSRSSCTAAVADGEVDVIAAYTSDGRIAQYDLVVLDDPKHAIPPYDAVLLVSPQRANDAALLDALRPLIGAIDVDADARGQPARIGRRQRARPARRRAGCGTRSSARRYAGRLAGLDRATVSGSSRRLSAWTLK